MIASGQLNGQSSKIAFIYSPQIYEGVSSNDTSLAKLIPQIPLGNVFSITQHAVNNHRLADLRHQ